MNYCCLALQMFFCQIVSSSDLEENLRPSQERVCYAKDTPFGIAND
jgi:hypothetical protein